MNEYIKIEKLNKKYKNIEACNNINLNINRGEIVSIIGESGSGKSTLLKILAGFENSDSGKFLLNNNIIFDEVNYVKIEKRNIGILFQEYSLFPNLSILQNLKIAKNELSDSDNRIINNELSAFIDRYPHQISGGQQQRVALIRTLLLNPNLILLDEPFSSLDENTKTNLRLEFKRIIRVRNITTILVTHDINDAIEFSDRIIVMKDGKIVENNTYSNIILNSKSEYIASLFKHLNICDGNLFGLKENKIGIRLEDIEINKGDYNAEVLDIIPFYGKYKLKLNYNNFILYCFSNNYYEKHIQIQFNLNLEKVVSLID